jgi:hypothetical protein
MVPPVLFRNADPFFGLQISRGYFRSKFRGTMSEMFVPLILICSVELGCQTIAGPRFEDLDSCTVSLRSAVLSLESGLGPKGVVAGALCFEWLIGDPA